MVLWFSQGGHGTLIYFFSFQGLHRLFQRFHSFFRALNVSDMDPTQSTGQFAPQAIFFNLCGLIDMSNNGNRLLSYTNLNTIFTISPLPKGFSTKMPKIFHCGALCSHWDRPLSWYIVLYFLIDWSILNLHYSSISIILFGKMKKETKTTSNRS